MALAMEEQEEEFNNILEEKEEELILIDTKCRLFEEEYKKAMRIS